MMSRHKRIALRVSGFVVDYLLALPIGCVAALVWANTFPDSYYRFAQAIAFAVNDVGMVFFLALITKEVAEATLPGGALHPWRRAALPVVAAIGGAGGGSGVRARLGWIILMSKRKTNGAAAGSGDLGWTGDLIQNCQPVQIAELAKLET